MPANENLSGRSGNFWIILGYGVISAAHTLLADQGGPAFDSVRSALIEGDPVYPHAGIHLSNHIQICVRRTDNIRGYFYPFP